jgi:death-on-curing protein
VRVLILEEVLELHKRLLEQSGGSPGVRDRDALESALAQPVMSFGGSDLYPSLVEKAAALGFSLVKNHPFTDGNKRIGHAAMEVFLVLNGYEVAASVEEQEAIFLGLAAGELGRDEFVAWLEAHTVRRRAA